MQIIGAARGTRAEPAVKAASGVEALTMEIVKVFPEVFNESTGGVKKTEQKGVTHGMEDQL
jgi:hypothetical protein